MPPNIGQAVVCKDVLRIGDDFGDNECSFTCTLAAGHDGPHCDQFEFEGRLVVVEWQIEDTE